MTLLKRVGAVLTGRAGWRSLGHYDESKHGAWITGSRASATGINVTPETALAVSTVFACVSIISRTIATLPLITYRRLSRGKERAHDYVLYPLLHDAPNEEQTSLEFREMISAHLLLRGNGYVAIERKNGWPARLVPLHPDNVKPKRQKDGRLVYSWTPSNQDPRMFMPSRGEIMHLRVGISPDGITGISIIEIARESMGYALALEEYGARMFSNGAQFSGYLKHPGSLKPDTHEQLKKDFAEKYTGLANAWRPLILEQGMDWVSIGMKASDAEFLSSRKFQVSEVARWFMVPPHMIGDVEKTTSWGTGIEQQMQGFINFTMSYWLKLWEQCIYRDLIPPEDRREYFSEFLVEGLLRGDTAARGEFYNKLFSLGSLSPNEIREMENRNPIEGGDRYFVPANNVVPLDKIDDFLAKQKQKEIKSNGQETPSV